MNPWRPKVGDMVQIWDGLEFNGKEDTAKITEHGHYGVIVDISKKTDTFINSRGEEKLLGNIVEGEVFKVLLSTTPKRKPDTHHYFNVKHFHQHLLREVKARQVSTRHRKVKV